MIHPMWPDGQALTVAALGATVVAVLGGIATQIGPWYRALAKPWFQPPDWLFGPAWTVIFALTALAIATAWTVASPGYRPAIVAAALVNGVANVLWSVLFFTLRRPDWALVEVVLLWLSIVALMVVVARVSLYATLLLLAYLAWVSFAAVLNLAVVRLNGPF
jgi:tryptophan-rich sensory protein